MFLKEELSAAELESMMMTDEDREKKEALIDYFIAKNYTSSVRILRRFKILFLGPEDGYNGTGCTISALFGVPCKVIVLNKYLTPESLVVVARHEILHNMLSHFLRAAEILKNLKLKTPAGEYIKLNDTTVLKDVIDYAVNIAEDLDLTTVMTKEEREGSAHIRFFRPLTEEEKAAGEELGKVVKEISGYVIEDNNDWKHLKNATLGQCLQDVLYGEVLEWDGPRPPRLKNAPQQQEGDDVDEDGEGGEGEGGEGEDIEWVIVDGIKYDDETFLDEYGNPVELKE